MKTLVLGLGNDLLGDDAVGIIAVRRLSGEIPGQADFVESGLHGIALIDILAGYERAIIVDAIRTGSLPPGTIIELRPEDLRVVHSPSPHYSGLPEMIQLARELDMAFPENIRILAVEIVDPLTLGGDMSSPVSSALEELIWRIKDRLYFWERENPAGRGRNPVLH